MSGALGHPRYDPHGAPIPTAAGEIEEADLISVADAPVGRALELRQVGTEDPARLRYLAEEGLVPGAHLTVTDRQPFNGPTTVQLSLGLRVIGRELAQLLWCREAAS
jgi:DtxR family Mn-dependent transcriptional regulator